jgi:glutamyl-tRNA synthetase
MTKISAPITQATGSDIRVRFSPSPTGIPHVGLIRTALFNWAYARHHGGKFVFRVEDTDAARDSEESLQQIMDGLHWLGIEWDEGFSVGGDRGPYRQSERKEIYKQVIEKLIASGQVYESFLTGEEIEQRNIANGRAKQLGYDNSERNLTEEQKKAYRDEGRQPALRVRVPDQEIKFTDLVRGEVSFPVGSFPDFVVVRPNGEPLYTLVNPVDDALMGITHVLRGEDLLSSTPRQIVLYNAMFEAGVASFIPKFGHLPFVMGEGNKKLSKRDPESDLFVHKKRGFIHEGLLNYLSLLGWSIGPDRDIFSLAELVSNFDVENVNPNPARFDLAKAEAINAAHIRLLDPADFEQRLIPYLQAEGLVDTEPSEEQLAILRSSAPLIQERITVLSESVEMLRFLFVEKIQHDEDSLAKLPDNTKEIIDASVATLEALEVWETESIQNALQAELIEKMQLKPRIAFGPLRSAVSGRRVSPPLFESLEILGKEISIQRLREFPSVLASR